MQSSQAERVWSAAMHMQAMQNSGPTRKLHARECLNIVTPSVSFTNIVSAPPKSNSRVHHTTAVPSDNAGEEQATLPRYLYAIHV